MHRRTFSLLLACILLLLEAPITASAAEYSIGSQNIMLEDGSYLEIIITETGTRASGTKSGSKVTNYRDSEGVLQWQAVLSANFTYSGTTATCTSANCTVTIYNSAWYVISNSTSRSGNAATTELTMGYKVLGVTTFRPAYTIILSCDPNGNLS